MFGSVTNPFTYFRQLPAEQKRFTILCFFGSLALHILASVYSIGFHQYDEHFQILEFAGLKLGWTSTQYLPWEYFCEIRPATQPFFAYILIRYFHINDPWQAAFVLRFISGVLGWFVMVYFTLVIIQQFSSKKLQKWLVALSALLWFFPYLHVRYSSEGWSATFFFMGLALFIQSLNEENLSEARKYLLLLGAGFLFGFSLIFRIQSLLFLPGLFLWALIIERMKFGKLFFLGIITCASFSLGILADRWFYGHWVFTPWKYYEANILQHRAAYFGVSPWYYFFQETVAKFGPLFGLPLIIGIIVAWIRNPKNLLTWSIVPFVLLHCLIGHKELRFLFPMTNAIPVFFIMAVSGINLFRENTKIRRVALTLTAIFWISNMVEAINISLRPAEAGLSRFYHIHKAFRNEEINVISLGEDPYHSMAALDIRYYMTPNLHTMSACSMEELRYMVKHSTRPMFFFGSGRGFEEPDAMKDLGLPHTPEYYSLPSWFEKININQWVSRTAVWSLYNVRPDLSKGHPDL